MKKCSRCKKEKTLEDFNFKNKSKGIRQKACKLCTRLEVRNHYNKNRKYYLKKAGIRNRKQRKISQEYIFEYLTQHPCIDCGETDPVVLEFDHKPEEEKLESVSVFLGHNYPLSTIKKEIEKCEVRCANCHRRKTAKKFDWYKLNKRP
ncbi:MAG: hypothetical protein GWP15_01430 [Nitrospirae bacterium]|nr:hypothetical protein [Nitrospirota bacterium]